jgi:hypothetical protein
MSLVVQLTWEEVLLGATVGVRRHVNARVKKRVPVFLKPPWQLDCEAALGELAFARGTGLYWPASVDWDADVGDVVGGHHVRSTDNEKGGLPVHKKDVDDGTFVLVIGSVRDWTIVGWCRGDEGKRIGTWRDDWTKPAYCVPQRLLHSWPPRPEDQHTLATVLA